MVAASALALSPTPSYAQGEDQEGGAQESGAGDLNEGDEAEAPERSSSPRTSVRRSQGEQASGEEERRAVQARAEAVEVEEIGALVRRPTGWVIVPSGPGAVATFRSTADREAQLEVRVSGEILVARAERYAQSFQNQIQSAGFRVETAERDTNFAGRVGDLVTYGVEADDEVYRLVTWLHHSDERMWVFSLFCLEERLDAYMAVFEELITELRWSGEEVSDAVESGD